MEDGCYLRNYVRVSFHVPDWPTNPYIFYHIFYSFSWLPNISPTPLSLCLPVEHFSQLTEVPIPFEALPISYLLQCPCGHMMVRVPRFWQGWTFEAEPPQLEVIRSPRDSLESELWGIGLLKQLCIKVLVWFFSASSCASSPLPLDLMLPGRNWKEFSLHEQSGME